MKLLRAAAAGVSLVLSAAALAGAGGSGLPASSRGTVTYVDFWASWCGPCAEAFPWLNAMQAKYAAQGLKVVGVGVDEEDASASRFLKEHPAQFQIRRDAKGALAEHYGVEGMPYAVILDGSGRVVHRHTGYRAADAADYEKAIQAALAAGKHSKKKSSR